ncbi:ABC transporter [Apiospora arundinis]
MLGKLFNLTSSAGASNPPPPSQLPSSPSPESVQEEIHTRTPPGNFDYDGLIDLDVRDVRVVVMQDSLGSVNPALLFDSHPGPTVSDRPPTSSGYPQGSVQDRRNPTSPRKTSVSYSRPMVIQPESPQPRQGAFDRRPSVQSRHYHHVESDTQRASREYREELANFTSCIFANSEVMSYKGTSTKVHIVPTEFRSDISSSYVGDGKGSMGRASMRSSKLAQSFTSESASAAFEAPTHSLRPLERKKVLITRLFPVNLPNDEIETPASASGPTPLSRHSEDGGFPFPISPDESGPKKKKPQPKQKRTPMYAVALVLHLPASTPATGSAPTKPVFKGPSSYSENDSFPSSFNSTRRSGWSMAGSGLGAESFDTAYSNDGEDGMDAITQHWDIIMRALTHLQSVVATTLFPMLKAVDYSSPEPFHANVPAQMARTSSVSTHRRGSTASQMKPPKTNAKLVTLQANCLMQETAVSREVDAARVRIVTGLRATRVITGQGRWGPWRDEARWVAKWAGGKEQGFFFFTLLTGFLATHNDWLQALSPVWYRKRYYQQQKGRGEEDTSLPCRTIIVSNDKMVARRLIFLLSAFLPTNQQLPSVRSFRPTTSASFSHSPPVVVPILKEEVLRRKLNRKPPTVPRGPSHGRSFSIQSQATTRSATGIPAQLAHLSLDTQHSRRMSDAIFKHTTLPMPGNDLNTRKSSAATTNTITPDAAVPHFSSLHRADTRRSNRPGSSGSTAADDLKRTLRRGESISEGTADSRSRGSNWGSVISTLWNARRKGSTASITQTTLDLPSGRPSPLPSPLMPNMRRDRLSEMAEEGQTIDPPSPTQQQLGAESNSPKTPMDQQPETPKNKTERSDSSNKRVPDPLGAFESPVKTTINSDDGVIDVDIQFPDYLATLDSAVSSPSSSGYLSTPGIGSAMDSFGQLSRIAIDGDAPLNVAGWLQQYHRDFALQAVAPQADLLDKVRESLRAEPTPPVFSQQLGSEWPAEQWVDVSSAIIADTTNFTIKRLSYKRLIKPKFAVDRSSGTHLSSSGYPFSSSLMTPALSPYEQPLNEKIEEEVLVTLDETLIEAIERVVAQSNDHSSKDSSATSSRSASKRRERRDSELSDQGNTVAVAVPSEAQEVPRAECKSVVLGTLEGIVQDVVDQREKEGHSPSSGVRYAPQREKESVLRTAIRGWLDTVELGDT